MGAVESKVEIGDYTGAEELIDQKIDAHAVVVERVRSLVVSKHLAATSPRTTMIHLTVGWGLAVVAGVVGAVVNEIAVWVVAWLVIAAILVGNAALTHEAVHGHLFPTRRWNRIVATFALSMLLGSFATYRCYHLEHHARTARPGDPEMTPLNFKARWQYLAIMVFGGLLVLIENTTYTVLTVIGRPPKWVRTAQQRRAIRWNGLLLLVVAGAIATGLIFDTSLTLNVWVIPYAIGFSVFLPLLLVPEHYGAPGEGCILDNTRTVHSNPIVRWVFWNNNFHAAHHLAPVVPYNKIQEVDELLNGDAGIDQRWRVGSYSAFHVGTLLRLAYNQPTSTDD